MVCHSGNQTNQNGPRKPPQHGSEYLRAIGSEREPDGDLFGLLRNGVTDETKKADDCEEDGNAAQQADDGGDLLDLGDILAEAGGERSDRWIKSGVDAAGNRLDGWVESLRIAGSPDQD